MNENGMRYFVSTGYGPMLEVGKEEYIRAERSAGFRPKFGDGISTASFSNGYISGRVEYPQSDIDLGWDVPSPLQPSTLRYPCCGAWWEDGCLCDTEI